MQRVLSLYQSTIGKKALIAITGLLLTGFLMAHMAGLLGFFAGQQAFNDYSALLRKLPGGLWVPRLVLLGAIGLHIKLTVELVALQAAARPVGYREKKNTASSYASRTMKYSGPFILFFVVFHILHLTAGMPVVPVKFVEHDVYTNVVNGFQIPWVALLYVVAVALVGVHLSHGVWSMFQTLGWNRPHLNGILKQGAMVFSAVLSLGFILVPTVVVLRYFMG